MTRFHVNRRQFIGSAAALSAAALLHHSATAAEALEQRVGLTPSATYPELKSTLTIADPSRIRMLQLTDIHFYGNDDPAMDLRTLEEIPRLIDKTQPEILLVSGDLWSDNPDGRGAEYQAFALDKLAKWGVPWLFVWGNHDQLDDYAKGHDTFHDAKGSLYRGGASGGNYVVALQDKGGNACWDLVCMNSMDGGLLQLQRDWLKALPGQDYRPTAKNAFAIVHIPVKQYTEVWAAEKTGGVFLEEVCSWEEDGTSLPLIDALGTVRAYFCGHDHVNDYKGTWGGVELNYGRASGHGGYGGDKVPKGGKIITVNAETGKYTAESILPDGSTWNSEPGKKIDKVEALPWKSA
jgi:hypothetical protein